MCNGEASGSKRTLHVGFHLVMLQEARVSRASLLGATSVAKDTVLTLVCEYFHRGWWLHSQLRLISEKFSWVSFKGFEVQSVAGVLDVIFGCLLLDSLRSSHL